MVSVSSFPMCRRGGGGLSEASEVAPPENELQSNFPVSSFFSLSISLQDVISVFTNKYLLPLVADKVWVLRIYFI